eukprot:Rmarinus@m.12766
MSSTRVIAGLAGIAGVLVGYSVRDFKLPTNGSSFPFSSKPPSPDEVVEDLELVQAQVIFRHGARTPLTELNEQLDGGVKWDVTEGAEDVLTTKIRLEDMQGNKNPRSTVDARQHAVELHGGDKRGQLSALGAHQLVEVGGRLRKRYIEDLKLTGHQYSPDDVAVRSTNVLRTVLSARGILTGMYPGRNKGDEPIVIKVDHTPKEIWHPNPNSCPRLAEIFDHLRETYTEHPPVKDTREDLRKAIKAETVPNVVELRDVFVALEAHGKGLPEGLRDKPELVDKVDNLAGWVVGRYFGHEEAVKLAVGPALKSLEKGFEKYVNEHPDAKRLHLISSHDTTIVSILSALGAYSNEWPPYASTLALELYRRPEEGEEEAQSGKDRDNFFVRVLYNEEDLPIPACGNSSVCKYQDFIDLLQSKQPEDWHAHCKATKTPKFSGDGDSLVSSRNAPKKVRDSI